MTIPQVAHGLEPYLKSRGCRIFSYGNASHGFKDILLHLKKAGCARIPNVVMPSYIPAKLYRTALAAGYEARFYDVGQECRFDPQQVEDLIDEQTTSIFVVHYFGFPADLKSLGEICARHHIALVEDCAHVLLAAIDGRALGTIGDFSIFSARKMLQLSDGGVLAINNAARSFTPTYNGRVRSSYTGSRFLLSRAKRMYLRMMRGRDFLHVARAPEIGWIDPKRAAAIRVRRMSFFTSMIERTSDIHHISRTRRVNYFQLSEVLRDFGFLRPVYPRLPDTWTPYSLPMMVDHGKRLHLQAQLLKYGISCGLGWPESPFCNHSPGAKELSNSLIEFPVHPLVLETQIERMVDACKAFQRKNGTS